MDTEKKQLIYFDVNSEKLQVFFAIMAFIEHQKEDVLFPYDSNNKTLLNEASKILNIKLVPREKHIKDEVKIFIEVDHSTPFTKIEGVKEAPLIFPQYISRKFSKPLNNKISKIYFRGLFTKSRLIESAKFFLEIKDFYAFFQLIIKFIKSRFLKSSSFIIDSATVYFHFTSRGRQMEFKYIDNDYFEEMSKYKIVFCPKGDFIWTYRFFEAIQVGSLPYCRYKAESYNGFNYIEKFIGYSQNYKSLVEQNFEKFKNQFFINNLGSRFNDSTS